MRTLLAPVRCALPLYVVHATLRAAPPATGRTGSARGVVAPALLDRGVLDTAFCTTVETMGAAKIAVAAPAKNSVLPAIVHIVSRVRKVFIQTPASNEIVRRCGKLQKSRKFNLIIKRNNSL
jgi:hypothetical protein